MDAHESQDRLARVLRRSSVLPSPADNAGFGTSVSVRQPTAAEEAEDLNASMIEMQEQKTGEEWRSVLQRSGLDFSGWRLWRTPKPFDLYDALFRDTIRMKYPKTFGIHND